MIQRRLFPLTVMVREPLVRVGVLPQPAVSARAGARKEMAARRPKSHLREGCECMLVVGDGVLLTGNVRFG